MQMEKQETIQRIGLLMAYSAQSGAYTSQAQKFILRKFTPEEQFQIVQEFMTATGPLSAPDKVREQVQELAQELGAR